MFSKSPKYSSIISIHALREEGDLHPEDAPAAPDPISIHALREEGDDWKTTIEVKPVYFYPRPPRGGRRTDGKIVIFDQKISIHALREEGDLPTAATQPLVIVISIHALREEGDLPRRWPSTPPCRFLSTPSARRATCFHGHAPFSKSISIHALREEGDFGTRYYANQYEQFLSTPSARRATCSMLTSRWLWEISIHALREEGDTFPRAISPLESRFLSTPSARRATRLFDGFSESFHISIHALREEGDFRDSSTITKKGDFYPRPPRGGRLRMLLNSALISLFLSTPSARRATEPLLPNHSVGSISIHALREEGDGRRQRAGRRHHRISIHALREEGDPYGAHQIRSPKGFLSTPSARRATHGLH